MRQTVLMTVCVTAGLRCPRKAGDPTALGAVQTCQWGCSVKESCL